MYIYVGYYAYLLLVPSGNIIFGMLNIFSYTMLKLCKMGGALKIICL